MNRQGISVNWQIAVRVLAIVLGVFVANRTFNHFNAWLGICFYVAIVLYISNFITKLYKHYEKL